MARCPNCGRELDKPEKSWKYGQYNVQSFTCQCGTKFRNYIKEGKHAFTLRLEKGKGFVKA